MNPKDVTAPLSGRPLRAATGYWAFVPAPLPPAITYDSKTALLLSLADAALSELSGLGRYLPNPDLLIAPYVEARGGRLQPHRGNSGGLVRPAA